MNKLSGDFGGNEAFKQSMAAQMRLAAAQARQIDPDAADAALPTFNLPNEAWPPHFRTGATVEFEPVQLEELLSGDFLVVRRGQALRVCRFVGWRYDGASVSLVVRFRPEKKDTELLPSSAFLGTVTSVTKGSKKVEPNSGKSLDRLIANWTRCGTSSPFRQAYETFREILLIMETKDDNKPKPPGFWDAWRMLHEYHRKCMEEEKKAKAAADAAAQSTEELRAVRGLNAAGTNEALARQLGLKNTNS